MVGRLVTAAKGTESALENPGKGKMYPKRLVKIWKCLVNYITCLQLRPLGRPRRRWEDNIRMDLQEVGLGYEDWIGLA